jgi:hypothetical protein
MTEPGGENIAQAVSPADVPQTARRVATRARVYTAFVLGSVLGIAVMLFYAPARGATTRRYVRRRARAGQRHLNRIITKSIHAVDDGRARVSSAIDEGRSRWESLKTHAENAMDEGLDAATRMVEQGRQTADEMKRRFGRISAAVGAGRYGSFGR